MDVLLVSIRLIFMGVFFLWVFVLLPLEPFLTTVSTDKKFTIALDTIIF